MAPKGYILTGWGMSELCMQLSPQPTLSKHVPLPCRCCRPRAALAVCGVSQHSLTNVQTTVQSRSPEQVVWTLGRRSGASAICSPAISSSLVLSPSCSWDEVLGAEMGWKQVQVLIEETSSSGSWEEETLLSACFQFGASFQAPSSSSAGIRLVPGFHLGYAAPF